MDECSHEGMCPNGQCINVDGSYKCHCNDGYKQSPNQQICIGKLLRSTFTSYETGFVRSLKTWKVAELENLFSRPEKSLNVYAVTVLFL